LKQLIYAVIYFSVIFKEGAFAVQAPTRHTRCYSV